jgi:DNA-binding response OmpR family regulator
MTKTSGESARGAEKPPAASQALRVLIADDDRDTVMTLMVVLRQEGHEVRGVYNGKQALEAIRQFDPDAVLLDIAMPELSGWEVVRRVKERLARRPLMIGISGEYKHSVDRILSEIIGFDHYLTKPYEASDILRLLAPLRLPRLGA